MTFPLSSSRVTSILDDLLTEEELIETFTLTTDEIHSLALKNITISEEDISLNKLGLVVNFSAPIENQKKSIAYAILAASRGDEDALEFISDACYKIAEECEEKDKIYFYEIYAEFGTPEAQFVMGEVCSGAPIGLYGNYEEVERNKNPEKAIYFMSLPQEEDIRMHKKRLKNFVLYLLQLLERVFFLVL